MEKNIIEVNNLTKNYKDVEAVKNLSFNVKEGEIYAFLGTNGAGKSTIIKVITSMIKPTSGSIKVDGEEVSNNKNNLKRIFGVALQDTAIDPNLTGRELITLQAQLFGFSRKNAKKRSQELVELLDMMDFADRKSGKYSGGMKRRLDLALTIVHKPKILFLDEPTVGLDPISREKIWKEILKLNRDFNTTIFFSTQYLEEADKYAQKVCIIKNGKKVVEEKTNILKQSFDKNIIKFIFNSNKELVKAKKILNNDFEIKNSDNNSLSIYSEKSDKKENYLLNVIKKLTENNVAFIDLNVSSTNLDDVFINLMNDNQEVVYDK
ncbi:MAG: ABC transporter ATP-binding protein [Thermotogota bacterium]